MQNKPDSSQLAKKILGEFVDMLHCAMLPFIIMCIFSSTIVLFADMDDITVQVLAVVVGDVLIVGSYVIFGKQNGATAYNTYYLNESKRALGNTEQKVVFRTGEYSLWKGFVIPVISCVPFMLFLLIEMCLPNAFCQVMLRYAFGWAYYPAVMTGLHQSFALVFIVAPVAAHAAGYFAGMKSEEKKQALQAEEEQNRRGKKRKK